MNGKGQPRPCGMAAPVGPDMGFPSFRVQIAACTLPGFVRSLRLAFRIAPSAVPGTLPLYAAAPSAPPQSAAKPRTVPAVPSARAADSLMNRRPEKTG